MSLFLGAFYNVKITKNGQTYTRDGSGGTSAFPIFFNSISRVFVKIRSSEIATYELTLTPSYSDAMKILKSGLLGLGIGSKTQTPSADGQAPSTGTQTNNAKDVIKNAMTGFAQISIQLLRPNERFGDKNYETKEFVGSLVQPEVNIQNNDVTITLKGYANAIFLAGPTYQFKLEGQTIGDIVTTCCDLIGYNKPGYVPKKDSGSDHTESVNKKLAEKVTDQVKSDTPFNMIRWALGLQRLSITEDLDNPNQFIIYDTDISHFKSQKAKYTFVQWRQIDPSKNVFPLLEFRMESAKSLFLSGRAFGNYTSGLNELTKKSINSQTNPSTDQTAEQVKNSSTVTTEDKETKVFPGWVSMVPTQAANEQAQMGSNQVVTGTSNFQKFSLTTYGLPDIAPLDQVNMMIGDLEELSGVLIVSSVAHTIDNGGWITELETTKIGDISQEANAKLAPQMTAPTVSDRSAKKLQSLDRGAAV